MYLILHHALIVQLWHRYMYINIKLSKYTVIPFTSLHNHNFFCTVHISTVPMHNSSEFKTIQSSRKNIRDHHYICHEVNKSIDHLCLKERHFANMMYPVSHHIITGWRRDIERIRYRLRLLPRE